MKGEKDMKYINYQRRAQKAHKKQWRKRFTKRAMRNLYNALMKATQDYNPFQNLNKQYKEW